MGNERTELGRKNGGGFGGNEQKRKERKFHPVFFVSLIPFPLPENRESNIMGVPGGRATKEGERQKKIIMVKQHEIRERRRGREAIENNHLERG